MTNIYIAEDGTEFASKKDCIVYEKVLKVIETDDNNSGLKQALITIAEYCNSQIDCWNCPIFISKGCILQSKVPNYWLRLKEKENKK